VCYLCTFRCACQSFKSWYHCIYCIDIHSFLTLIENRKSRKKKNIIDFYEMLTSWNQLSIVKLTVDINSYGYHNTIITNVCWNMIINTDFYVSGGFLVVMTTIIIPVTSRDANKLTSSLPWHIRYTSSHKD
jgi:hypothetical protein